MITVSLSFNVLGWILFGLIIKKSLEKILFCLGQDMNFN